MIEALNLYKKYTDRCVAVEDISLKIRRGEFVFIIGQSGAGKSTLFKLIIREIKPTGGKLTVFGQDLAKMPGRRVPYLRRNIGMVFQDFRLLENRTAFENVAFAMQVTGAVSLREIKRRVSQVLEMVGLQEKFHTKAGSLSGGEQQRVGLARAIVNRPAIIIADEPTGNLDPENSLEIISLLHTINLRGATVLVATHNQEIVDAYQKRVIYLEKGRIASDVKRGAYVRGVLEQPALLYK